MATSCERLYREYGDKIHTMLFYALKYDKQDAEDLSQEVWSRVAKGLPSFAGDCRIYTWIYKIAQNVLYSHTRKQTQIPDDIVALEDVHLEAVERPDLDAEFDQRWAAIDAAISKLPEKLQGPYCLFALAGFSLKEVAEITGLEPATVRTRIHRARKALGYL